MNLQLRPVGKCHVRLPWLACQKQAPAEAEVLKTVKSVYQQRSTWEQQQPQPPAAATIAAAPPPPPPPPQAGAPPPPPPAAAAAPYTAAAAAAAPSAPSASASPSWGRGPLLLFPDTSAVLSMLGANLSLARPVVSLGELQRLAAAGRFGRSLPPEDQTFIVIADSVMKQLDGLKGVPETSQVTLQPRGNRIVP